MKHKDFLLSRKSMIAIGTIVGVLGLSGITYVVMNSKNLANTTALNGNTSTQFACALTGGSDPDSMKKYFSWNQNPTPTFIVSVGNTDTSLGVSSSTNALGALVKNGTPNRQMMFDFLFGDGGGHLYNTVTVKKSTDAWGANAFGHVDHVFTKLNPEGFLSTVKATDIYTKKETNCKAILIPKFSDSNVEYKVWKQAQGTTPAGFVYSHTLPPIQLKEAQLETFQIIMRNPTKSDSGNIKIVNNIAELDPQHIKITNVVFERTGSPSKNVDLKNFSFSIPPEGSVTISIQLIGQYVTQPVGVEKYLRMDITGNNVVASDTTSTQTRGISLRY